MALVDLGREMTEKFFNEGGEIHVQSEGYGLLLGFSFTNKQFRTLDKAVAYYRNYEQVNRPLLLIDENDPHPENPFNTGDAKVVRPE